VISPAFKAAERARKNFRPVSAPQRKTLASLSRRAGVELPQVRTKAQAGDALDRLKLFLTQPQLEGFNDSISQPCIGEVGR
jgi:hypothetical protein